MFEMHSIALPMIAWALLSTFALISALVIILSILASPKKIDTQGAPLSEKEFYQRFTAGEEVEICHVNQPSATGSTCLLETGKYGWRVVRMETSLNADEAGRGGLPTTDLLSRARWVKREPVNPSIFHWIDQERRTLFSRSTESL